MTFKLLVDECLTPALAQLAIDTGFPESTCVRDRGWASKKDWELLPLIVQHDYTLVTKNNIDFRGKHPPAPGGLYAGQALHAGLICLNLPDNQGAAEQLSIFELVLVYLKELGNLYNQVLEIHVGEDGEIEATIYVLPAEI